MEAAARIASCLTAAPASVVLFATGTTPMRTYEVLAGEYRGGTFDTGELTAVQLDEYVGLPPDDRRSLLGWMRHAVLDPLAIPDDRVILLSGNEADLVAACATYDTAVAHAGGLDLAILGLGPNGHVGFNEPPAGPDAPTRVVRLTPESIASNAPYWGTAHDVPACAVTAGMSTLLAARSILLLVSGAAKRTILHRVLHGPVSPEVPASYLRVARDVTVIADADALS